LLYGRLIEFAGNYFDLSTFPNGETKRALQRAVAKKAGKPYMADGSNKKGKTKKEKRQKQKELDGME